jgi:hypothetical protein
MENQMTQTEKDVMEFFKLISSPLPSKDMSDYWIPHFSKHEYPSHTSLGGKWLVFCTKENVDETWENICKAQDKKLLGDSSKVATALSSLRYKDKHVICIYTYDSSDMGDVMRVREGLKSIGFTEPLKYKRDIETIKGVYGCDNEFLLTV